MEYFWGLHLMQWFSKMLQQNQWQHIWDSCQTLQFIVQPYKENADGKVSFIHREQLEMEG